MNLPWGRTIKKFLFSVCKSYCILVRECNVLYTYETRRVVVTDGLGVTEGFKYGVSLDDLVFQRSLLLLGGVLLLGSTDGGEVRNYLLRVLSLSGTRLSAVGCKDIFLV